MIKLKPCPFCGFLPGGDMRDIVYPVGRLTDLYQCVCSNGECGATVLGYDEEDAMDNWNTRSYEAEIEHLTIADGSNTEYIHQLRDELTNAYKHISRLEDHMDQLLTSCYELETKNDQTIFHK